MSLCRARKVVLEDMFLSLSIGPFLKKSESKMFKKMSYMLRLKLRLRLRIGG